MSQKKLKNRKQVGTAVGFHLSDANLPKLNYVNLGAQSKQFYFVKNHNTFGLIGCADLRELIFASKNRWRIRSWNLSKFLMTSRRSGTGSPTSTSRGQSWGSSGKRPWPPSYPRSSFCRRRLRFVSTQLSKKCFVLRSRCCLAFHEHDSIYHLSWYEPSSPVTVHML